MVSCCENSCDVTQRNNPSNYTFHRFPSNSVLRAKWIRIINRLEWTPHKNSTVCSKHFEQKCFIQRKNRRVLMKETIPTLFVPISTKEIKIPVQWGHIAATLWGHENERPILAIHGWQENAGTWDTLVPMLNTKRPVLAIDLPGHGFSSKLPPGIPYDLWQWVQIIRHLKEHFKWNHVSLLGHSMGSVTCFRYAAIFPEVVDFYIGIESLDYYDFMGDTLLPVDEHYCDRVRRFYARNARRIPRLYTLQEISEVVLSGNSGSLSLESVPHLLKRGVIRSKSDPNKYYFSRDERLKSSHYIPNSKEFINALASQLTCPTIFFKGRESQYQTSVYTDSLRKLIQRNNSKFENYLVAGTHHLHLNTPENIAPLINNFLEKYI